MPRQHLARLRLEVLEDRFVPASLAALGDNNRLLIFDSATPSIASSVSITGLSAGESLSGLDRWSINGQLYALGNRQVTRNSPLFGSFMVNLTTFYTINSNTGQATRVSNTYENAMIPGIPTNGPGKVFTTLGTLNTGNNLTARLLDLTGALNEIDTLQRAFYPDILSSSATQGSPGTITNGGALAYVSGDVNQGKDLLLVDAAVVPAVALPTNMYFLDAKNGVLAKQTMTPNFITPPSGIQTVGSLGVTFTSSGGFEITADGTAYAALTTASGSKLYTIDLATGQATLVGAIAGASSVTGLAAILSGDQNQAPAITGPRDVLSFEDATYTYSLASSNGIVVNDPDGSLNEIYTAEIHSVVFPANSFPNNAALYTLASTTGLTFVQGDGTNDSHMIFRGTLAAINHALDGIQVRTVYPDRFSYTYPESWGQLRVSDTNTTHAGGAAIAIHEFSINFQPVDDGPPIARDYTLTLPQGQDTVQQGVFDTDTFGVDLDEVYLLKASIVSVSQGVHGGTVTFTNPPPSQPFWANVYYTRPAGFVGSDSFTYTIADGSGNFATGTITVNVQGTTKLSLFALGADRGNLPTVAVIDAQSKNEIATFQAFDTKFKGGVRVSIGDLNNDQQNDIVAAQAREGDGWVRAFTSSGIPLAGKWGQGIQPFGKTKQALEVAVGDINGDGYADVAVTGLNKNTPVIRFFDGRSAVLIGERVQPGLRGLFSFTLADVNHDQKADLVTFSSDGKKTAVLAYSAGLGKALPLSNPFTGFDAGNTRREPTRRLTGLSIAVGDIDGDGQADVVASVTTQTGMTHVNAYSSLNGNSSITYQQPDRFIGNGVMNARVALVDLNGDGISDILLGTSEGSGPAGDLLGFSNNLVDLLFSQPQSFRWNRGFSIAAG